MQALGNNRFFSVVFFISLEGQLVTSRVCLILKLSVSSSLELEETIFVWSMSVWCLRYTVLHRNLCTYLVPFLVHQGFS